MLKFNILTTPGVLVGHIFEFYKLSEKVFI